MFRELLSYCINSIESSGSYSLRLAFTAQETRLFVNFWSGNSLHSMCLAVLPGRLTNQSALIPIISSFFALLDKEVHLLFLSGFSRRLAWTISRVLPQHKRICSTPKFSPEDLEDLLLVPTVQILDRLDFRSVLDFLLLRLRSACGSSWLSSLPNFEKVYLLYFIFQTFCRNICLVT